MMGEIRCADEGNGKQVVVLYPHITQAEEMALGLNVNLVEGILVFSSSSDPQPGAATPSLLVNEL